MGIPRSELPRRLTLPSRTSPEGRFRDASPAGRPHARAGARPVPPRSWRERPGFVRGRDLHRAPPRRRRRLAHRAPLPVSGQPVRGRAELLVHHGRRRRRSDGDPHRQRRDRPLGGIRHGPGRRRGDEAARPGRGAAARDRGRDRGRMDLRDGERPARDPGAHDAAHPDAGHALDRPRALARHHPGLPPHRPRPGRAGVRGPWRRVRRACAQPCRVHVPGGRLGLVRPDAHAARLQHLRRRRQRRGEPPERHRRRPRAPRGVHGERRPRRAVRHPARGAAVRRRRDDRPGRGAQRDRRGRDRRGEPARRPGIRARAVRRRGAHRRRAPGPAAPAAGAGVTRGDAAGRREDRVNADAGRLVERALDAGDGVLRLQPTWVPRSFLVPGGRLRLAPSDLYALGAHRGGIDERWLGSTTPADNEGAPPDEGLSYVVGPDGERFTLRDAVAAAGPRLLGQRLAAAYGGWTVFAKFFDNRGPIPHHLHQRAHHAAQVGRAPKPEAYYFPPQLNAVPHGFPLTFFGLEPGTSPADVRRCLERWDDGDNGILDLSRAYRLRPGTGWLVQAGILHAPGTLVTYEPQWASDVAAMFQSMADDRPVPRRLLVKDVPPERHHDLDYLVGLIDWEATTDPCFKAHHYLEPVPLTPPAEGAEDRWVVYGLVEGKPLLAARELTLRPGAEVVLRDGAASCAVAVQGRGTLGRLAVEAPLVIRFGEMTADEFFITEPAAREGVRIRSTGAEPLVLLRYFGPEAIDGVPDIGVR